MAKLCIDARMISSSGIGTCLKYLIPYFSSQETTLLVRPQDVKIYPWLEQYSLKFCGSAIYSIKEQLELPRLIPKCDVFWSAHYNIPLAPIRAKRRIVTIHDVAHLHYQDSLGWKKKAYAKLILHQAVQRSDCVITDSLFSQKEIHKYLGCKKNVEVITLGLDRKKFSTELTQEEREIFRKKYHLPAEFFLFLGNVKPHKNLKLIVDAYEKYSMTTPLVVVGKMVELLGVDPLIHKIRRDPHLSRMIHFRGEVLDHDIPAFYQMATCLLFPSLYEGFGFPPLEAMASKCPVIASYAASIPEVVGKGAMLIDPLEPSQLFTAIKALVTDETLRRSLIEEGTRQVEKFSWTETARRYQEVFEVATC